MTWQLLAAVLGGVFTIAGSYFVARMGAKASMHATDTTAKLEEESNAVTGYHSLVADLRADIDRLRTDLEAVNRRLRALEDERRRDKSRIRQLVAWVIAMRQVLLSADVPLPDPPGGGDPDDLLATG
jgi:outer membrane murein-binding lipoprotein Lpp